MRVELKKIDKKFAADFPCFYFLLNTKILNIYNYYDNELRSRVGWRQCLEEEYSLSRRYTRGIFFFLVN